MNKPVVLICQPLLFQQPGPYRDTLEAAGLDVRYPAVGGRVLTEAELASEIEGVSATLASVEPYNAAILAKATSLRVISRTGVGYDSIDVAEATRRGIAVAITPGTNHEAVAEHAFALLLAATKRIVSNHHRIVGGGFARQPTLSLRGQTLGLVGLGRIGRAVAHRAAAFGMNVIACDPLLKGAPKDCGDVRLVSFDELLSKADILSLHAAATPVTARLIDRESLALMKRGAILINTARGSLVDEAALCEALESGHLAAAGIDVFEREPPGDSPLVSPLVAAPNVVLSPHIAGIDQQALVDMATMAAETIAQFFRGQWPEERIVNARELRDARFAN